TRSFISRADLLVKVIAAIRFAGKRPDPTRYAIFSTITRVLPLPAPASTSNGPSQCRTAADCGGVRPCIAGGSAWHASPQAVARRDAPAHPAERPGTRARCG